MHLLTLLAVPLAARIAIAARLTVSVASSPALGNPSTLPPSTHAVLLGPPGVRYDVPLRRDNTFDFPELDAASYLLTVHSRDHLFPPLRIDVSQSAGEPVNSKIEAWQTFRGNEWTHKGQHYGAGDNELNVQIRAIAPKNFYEERGGFNLMAFIKSPMILLGLFSVVLIFGMPYLLDNMDAETRAELEEMQKTSSLTGQNSAASQIQNFDLAGWMAGKNGGSNGGGTDPKK